MPIPTIGRRVWVWGAVQGVQISPSQPFDAGIVYVWGENFVNLDVCDHTGNRFPLSSVALREPRPEDSHSTIPGPVATWMPYQMK